MAYLAVETGSIGAVVVQSRYGRFGKRCLDLGLVLMLAPFAAPVIAVLWLLVRSDGGPGFFVHRRIGRGGRPVACIKLRSMVVDAQARLPGLLAQDPKAAREWSRTCKLQNDPRITGIGRVLRRTRLDELPQLWTVFTGGMSLVGPRPITEAELERYAPEEGIYLNQVPGLTGLWQIANRGQGDYRERVELDRIYGRLCSPGTDIAILLGTIGCVLRRSGC